MNQDIRYQNTERKIRETFLKLLETVGFQKITVRKLIEEAGINRSTFYLHYEDKYDLMHALEQEMITEASETVRSNILQGEGFDSDALFASATDFIRSHQDRFLLLAGPKGDPEFIKRYGEMIMEELLKNGLIELPAGVPAVYLRAAFSGISSSLFSTWLERGFRETPQEYLDIVQRLLRQFAHVSQTLFPEET